MSLKTGIHLALHALYFAIAAMVGLFGFMPNWMREQLDISEGFGDVGLFIFIFIFFMLVEIIVENSVLNQFEPTKMAKEMLQYLISAFMALGVFIMAGYMLGSSIKNQWFGYLLGLGIFILADWSCRSIMSTLVTKLFTPRKRQVIR